MSVVDLCGPSDNPSEGLLLGWEPQKEAKRQAIWDTSAEGHLMTIAPTGSGKGVSCIIPALLTWHGPAIVIDPRGENYAVTAGRRRALGQAVHVLDPFRITNAKSASLNPLDLLDFDSPDFDDNAAVIATLLIKGQPSHPDPYWDERATALIVSLIHNAFCDPLTHPSLKDVKEALFKSDARQHDNTHDLIGDLFDPQVRNKPRRSRKQRPLTSNEFGMDRTRASIFSTAASHLGFLRSDAVANTLRKSTINLNDITAGTPQTIYIVIPPDKLHSNQKLLRLWIGVMLTALMKRRLIPDPPTLVLIDEAAQLGALDEIRTIVTLMRGYGVRMWTFWQALTQLQRIYSDWETLVENSTTLQLFGATSRRTLTYLELDPPSNPNHQKQQMLLSRYGDAEIAIRPDYRTDPVFRGMASPNPFYAKPPTATILPFPQHPPIR